MSVQYGVDVINLGHSAGTANFAYLLNRHSLIHSTSNRKTRKGTWSGGGGFLVHHYEEFASPLQLPSYTHFGLKWGGDAVPTGARSVYPSVTAVTPPSYQSTQDYLSSWGIKGWKRARPGNPGASLAVSVAELFKDGLPKVPFRGLYQRGGIFKGPLKSLPARAMAAVGSFRNLGSEYLNIRFGWEPLIKDLIEMYNLTGTIDRRIADLRRNNGRSLKRERVLRNVSTVTSRTSGSTAGPFGFVRPTPIILGTGSSSWETIVTETEKIWFEGRYRYWVPDIGTQRWERKARLVLFGAIPTPHAVWKVMPWSWLIDWFSTIGDSLSNMSDNAVDNLVAQYAHVMRTFETKSVTTVHTSWSGRTSAPIYPSGSAVGSYTTKSVLKSRAVATPYGFGVAWNGLSAYQQSILAALGASRKSFL